MKKNLLIFTLLFSIISFSQIKGTVKDVHGNPLPYVNIYIENTYINTTTNELGNYELNYFEKKNVPLIFQYLGYKTEKHVLNISQYPYLFDNILSKQKSS